MSTIRKISCLCTVFALLMLATASPAFAQVPNTIEVTPPTLTVNEEDLPLPVPFEVNVTVYEVENVWGWQAKLYFNASILQCTGTDYPAGHIFDGQATVGPPAEINNTIGYVLLGLNLLTNEPPYNTFNGTGVLFRMMFNATDYGVSTMVFAQAPEIFYTYLYDPDFVEPTLTYIDGEVTVVYEFQSLLLVMLIMVAATAAVLFGRKMYPSVR